MPVDLTPKKHHGYAVIIFILGTLLPPLAVAARFGIGRDFWINLFLTLCGYIPGHAHNFYIQNIRNNKTHARTPKWAQRYGLVDTSTIRRKERKSQWATRYNDRLPNSTLEGRPYEEGQDGMDHGSSVDVGSTENGRGDLWRPEDEQFYRNERAADSSASGGGGRWRYPANFDDVSIDNTPPPSKPSKKKKEKKDRWARTEDAYSYTEERRKKKKKKSKKASGDSVYSQDDDTVPDRPEDPEGGVYGNPRQEQQQPQRTQTTTEEIFNHEF